MTLLARKLTARCFSVIICICTGVNTFVRNHSRLFDAESKTETPKGITWGLTCRLEDLDYDICLFANTCTDLQSKVNEMVGNYIFARCNLKRVVVVEALKCAATL